MTKRDVAVWFCKVTALTGMIVAVFTLLNSFGILLGLPVSSNFLGGAFELGLFFFVWLFAQGIGTELAAEGEVGDPITSKSDLNLLLLRCVGPGLFLYGALGLSTSLLTLGYYWLSGATRNGFFLQYLWYSVPGALLQATVGFFLAFAPRIRAMFRSR